MTPSSMQPGRAAAADREDGRNPHDRFGINRAKRGIRALMFGLAVAGVVVLAWIAGHRLGRGAQGATEPGHPAIATPAATAAATAELARRWTLGARRVYQLDSDVQITAEQGNTAAHMRLAGRWAETVAAVSPDEVALRVVIEQPALELSVPGGEGSPAHASADLSRAFMVALEPSGRVKEVYVEPSIDPTVAMLARSLAQSRQLVTNDDATWTSVERDTVGEYEAQYRRVEPGTIERTKQRYTRIPADAPAGKPGPEAEVHSTARFVLVEPADDVLHSHSSIRAPTTDDHTAFDVPAAHGNRAPIGAPTIRDRAASDARGSNAEQDLGVSSAVIESIDIDDRVRLVAMRGGSAVTIRAQTRFRLVEQGRDAGAVAFAAARGRLRAVRDPAAPDAKTARTGDENLVAGASLADLISALQNLGDGAESTKQRGALMARLAALFRIEPEAAHDVPALASELPASVRDAIIAALGAAGTPAAQGALRAMISDGELPRDVREHGAMVLGLTDKPDAASLSALAAEVGSDDARMHSTAMLALGNAARRAAGDEGTEGALQHLFAQSDAATSADDRALALRALGNVGDPRILPVLRVSLTSQSDDVRAAAIAALRFVTGPDADAMIASALANDPSAEVRSQAVFAASFRSLPALWPALVAALEGDAAPNVRLAVVNLFGQHRAEQPDASTRLRWASEHDTDDDVRGAAQRYL